ncbi:pseudouridine synthase [Chitinophaga vietnamensis]|uniref:pseudouridine synthase n=1 Tax=Chitinophaga vietnamensis TaxID=2593957 RepID=UPI0011780352|nr:pseudouridine synthase [Chitinophaga vietnamensis]
MAHRYFIVHKPYRMVSQFVSPDKVRLLGDLDFDFPEGTHAVGRLDNHSEGLLLLTTNKKVTQLLFQGTAPHTRTYLVKAKHVIKPESVQRLRDGIGIPAGPGELYHTKPCHVEVVPRPEGLQLREAEIEYSSYECTWLKITLTEGRYHQVRKMLEAIRHRCLRLIRLSIESIELGDLLPGEVREMPEDIFFQQLKIDDYR